MQATTVSITFSLWPPIFVMTRGVTQIPALPTLPSLNTPLPRYEPQRVAEAATEPSRPAVTQPSRSRVTGAHKCAWPGCKKPAKARGKFCGDTCRQRAHRAEKKNGATR